MTDDEKKTKHRHTDTVIRTQCEFPDCSIVETMSAKDDIQLVTDDKVRYYICKKCRPLWKLMNEELRVARHPERGRKIGRISSLSTWVILSGASLMIHNDDKI